MRNAAVFCLALAAALTGCSTANVSGQAGSLATSASGGSVGVNIQGTPAAAGIVVTTAVIAALVGIWRDAPPRHGAPAMLEGRAILEVDCTQPIADWSKNLKCK